MSDADEDRGPKTVTSTASITLDSQPSCLEFAKSHDLVVVGTYNLEEKEVSSDNDGSLESPSQRRTGSLLVFRITKDTVTLLQTKGLPYALLDLHFSPQDPSIFAVATSSGSLCFFKIDCENNGTLTLVKFFQICDSSILVLSFAFERPGSIASDLSPLLVASLSDGHLIVCSSGEVFGVISRIPAHSQEAWTVTWSIPSAEQSSHGDLHAQGLLSGGDDSMLAKHTGIRARYTGSLSAAEVDMDLYQARSQDVKTHGAGVTAIMPVEGLDDEVVITGCYDEYLRVLVPPRHGRGRSKVLAEEILGGGVWKLSRPFAICKDEQARTAKFRILASCMHAGARVLEIQNSAGCWSISVLAKFTEHESMNYASDVSRCADHFFVSTSFYDRKLCVWALEDIS